MSGFVDNANSMMSNEWGNVSNIGMGGSGTDTFNINDMGFGQDSSMDFSSIMGDFGKFTGGVSSLAQIGLGFKSLGMAEDMLDIKKDQWKMAKEEMNHMKGVRSNLTASYMGRTPAQQPPQQSQPVQPKQLKLA